MDIGRPTSTKHMESTAEQKGGSFSFVGKKKKQKRWKSSSRDQKKQAAHVGGNSRNQKQKKKKRLKGKMSGWACLPTLQGFSKEEGGHGRMVVGKQANPWRIVKVQGPITTESRM